MRRLTLFRLRQTCWRTRFIVLAVSLAVTSGAWLGTRDTATSNVSDLLRAGKLVAQVNDVPSHNRRYRASLVPTSNGWALRLANFEGQPISDAKLALQTWMPEEQTVVGRGASSVALGNGTYRIDGLQLGQRGWWNVRLDIMDSAVTDSLAFNLMIP